MAQRFTKEEVVAAMLNGYVTYEELGKHFGLTPQSMKSAMDKLNLVGGQLPQSVASAQPQNDYITWEELYRQYSDNTQAQFLIAECKVKRNMNATETRKWMEANFNCPTENFVWATFREAQIKERLKRIRKITDNGAYMNYPWMKETIETAKAMGIDPAEYNL